MRTAPNLADIKDVNLTTPSAGQALTFDGTTWNNSTPDVAPADRIVDGTTTLAVVETGALSLDSGAHRVLDVAPTTTTFHSATGTVEWCATMEVTDRADDYSWSVTDNHVALSGHPTDVATVLDVFRWTDATGALDVCSTSNTVASDPSISPFDTLPVLSGPQLDDVHIVFTYNISNWPYTESTQVNMAVANTELPDDSYLLSTNLPAGGAYSHYNPKVHVIDATNTRIISTVFDNTPTDFHYSTSTLVSNVNPQTRTVTWSTMFGIVPDRFIPAVNPQGNMVVAGNPSTGIDDDAVWSKASVFTMSGSTVSHSFDVSLANPLDEIYLNHGLVVGDVAILSGSVYDATNNKSDIIVAVNATTQELLWAFSTVNVPNSVTTSIAPHPTDNTSLVYMVGNGTTNGISLYVMNVTTGAVSSSYSVDVTPALIELTGVSLVMRNGRLHMYVSGYTSTTFVTHVCSIVTLGSRTIGPNVTLTPVTATMVPTTLTISAVTAIYKTVPWTTSVFSNAQVLLTPHTACPTSTWVGGYTPHTLNVDGYIGVTKGLSLNGDTGTVGQVVTRTVDGARWGTVSGGGTNFWRVTNNGNTSLYPPDWVDEDGTPTGDNGTRYTTPYNPQDYTGAEEISLYDNIALGRGTMCYAGLLNPDGGEGALTVTNNIAVGAYAMYNMGGPSANAATSNNVAIGTRTCAALTEGDDNVAIGKNVMNGVGIYQSSYNVAIGPDTLPMGGTYNVALGQSSGPTTVPSSSCVWIGESAGNGVTGLYGGAPSSVTVIGARAARQPREAIFHEGITAVGLYALASVTTPSGGTAHVDKTAAVGGQSLWHAKAPGEGMYDNIIEGTTAVGFNVGYGLRGTFNTAVGYNCMADSVRRNTTAVGVSAGEGGLGDYNTFVGENSGARTRGAYNTHLGYDAGYYVTFNNTTCLGYDSTVTGSNQVQLGNAATTTYAYGAVQNRSDARDKADVRDTVLGLNFVTALRPVDFKWNYRESYDELVTDENGKVTRIRHANDGSKTRSRYHHGVIAQEVKAVMDQAGVDFGGFQDHAVAGGEDVLSIGYDELIAPMIKAIQELTARLEAAEAKIALLEQ